MPTRLVRDGIIESRAVNQLSDQAEIFYRRLFSIVDDFGRYEVDIETLRLRLFGHQLDRRSLSDVRHMLAECCRVLTSDGQPLVAVYSVNSKQFLQINKFQQRVRTKSKYPSPEEGRPVKLDGEVRTKIQQLTDNDSSPPSNDGHVPADCGHVTAQSNTNSESNAESKTEPNTNAETATPPVGGDWPKVADLPLRLVGRKNVSVGDEAWSKFVSVADTRNVLRGSSEDWRAAMAHWNALDWESRLKAVDDVQKRARESPEMQSLPNTYLERKKWERPLERDVGMRRAGDGIDWDKLRGGV